jgi:hypothetical protein
METMEAQRRGRNGSREYFEASTERSRTETAKKERKIEGCGAVESTKARKKCGLNLGTDFNLSDDFGRFS